MQTAGQIGINDQNKSGYYFTSSHQENKHQIIPLFSNKLYLKIKFLSTKKNRLANIVASR